MTAILEAPLDAANGETKVEPQRVWKWTRDLYYRAAQLGWFEGRRVELIDGEIVEMAAMLGPHARVIMNNNDVWRDVLPRPDFRIRVQMPLDCGLPSQPEPDVAVVTREAMAAASPQGHPASAVLVVEVSDSTLRYDQTTKASLYAAANVPEYVICNLVEDRVEVRREPRPAPEARFGFDYASLHVYRRGESFALLSRPETLVSVEELLG